GGAVEVADGVGAVAAEVAPVPVPGAEVAVVADGDRGVVAAETDDDLVHVDLDGDAAPVQCGGELEPVIYAAHAGLLCAAPASRLCAARVPGPGSLSTMARPWRVAKALQAAVHGQRATLPRSASPALPGSVPVGPALTWRASRAAGGLTGTSS